MTPWRRTWTNHFSHGTPSPGKNDRKIPCPYGGLLGREMSRTDNSSVSNSTPRRHFLPLLRAMDPDLFRCTDAVKYSRKCQASAERQPLPITPQLRDALYEYLAMQTVLHPEDPEMRIHRQTLDNGLTLRGVFYFAPFTWDFSVTVHNAYFPRYGTAAHTCGMFASSPKVWRAEIRDMYTKKGQLPSSAPHHYYVSLVCDLPGCYSGPSSRALEGRARAAAGLVSPEAILARVREE